MPIPNADAAFVPEEKLVGYLLDATHAVGGAKARWFAARGFSTENAAELAAAPLALVRTSDDFVSESTPYGDKHFVRGRLECADGRRDDVVTVWFTETWAVRPRLVTAYPTVASP
ncbi:MAG: DUF6883 domain-containing protein [Lacipirellulaceae bacterium]